MPIDFPTSPTPNEVYSIGTKSWIWTGVAWRLFNPIQANYSYKPWIKKSANYTAELGDQILADTSGGAFTITLPATPVDGSSVIISDGNDWLTNNLTVARNGSTIEGLSENLVFDVKGAIVTLIYDGTTWEVFSSMGTGTSGASATVDDALALSIALG
jgi:hypothetical protein